LFRLRARFRVIAPHGLRFVEHQDAILGLATTPDGRRLISASKDTTLKVWDLETDRLEFTLSGHTAAANSVAVVRDGTLCISGSADGTIRLWHLTTGQLARTIFGHAGAVTGVATGSDDDWMISASTDGTVRVWNVLSGELLAVFTADGPVGSCATSADCRDIIATDPSNSGPVHILRLVTGASHDL
jgi:WD40 repeat protein